MDKKSILITGGSRSGKSKQSLSIGNGLPGKKVFIATAQALDKEMEERIEKHKNERGGDWLTIEEPINLFKTLKAKNCEADVLVLDCLTLWISNLLEARMEANEILNRCEQLAHLCNEIDCNVIVVTNEVGSGIVPISSLGRQFRDLAGSCNQIFAKIFNEVICMISGLPITIKPNIVNPPDQRFIPSGYQS